ILAQRSLCGRPPQQCWNQPGGRRTDFSAHKGQPLFEYPVGVLRLSSPRESPGEAVCPCTQIDSLRRNPLLSLDCLPVERLRFSETPFIAQQPGKQSPGPHRVAVIRSENPFEMRQSLVVKRLSFLPASLGGKCG